MRSRLNIHPSLLLCCLVSLCTSCSDLFEKDISEEEVVLLGPADDKTLHSGTIEFWWEEVDGATRYELEVVRGSFKTPEALEVDSTISSNIFQLYLAAGYYEWRVTAKNENSSSVSQVFQLGVDSAFSLNNEKVVLLYPALSDCISSNTILFRWVDLQVPGVRYLLDVRLGTFDEGLTVYSFETDLNQQSVTLDGDFEGSLSWGVRAVNDEGASPFSSYTFDFDRTSPEKVTLDEPVNGDTVTGVNIAFNWTGKPASGCPETDSIIIYTDSAATQAEVKDKQAAGVNSYTTDLEPGDYWWQVFRLDGAGNISPGSGLRKLYVEP